MRTTWDLPAGSDTKYRTGSGGPPQRYGVSHRDHRLCGGGWGRSRTDDTRIFNPLLYHLSYPAT